MNLLKLLKSAVHKSFENMITSFQNDCIQHKPHINYMSLNPLAKLSLSTLITRINRLCSKTSTSSDNSKTKTVFYLARTVVVLFNTIESLEAMCITYVDLKHTEKFIRENILKQEYVESFIDFVGVCCRAGAACSACTETLFDYQTYLECIDCILRENRIWLKFNEMENYGIVNFVFDAFKKLRLFNTNSCQTWIKEIRDIYNVDDDDDGGSCKQQKQQCQIQQHELPKKDVDDDIESEESLSTIDNNKVEDKKSEVDDEEEADDTAAMRIKINVRVETYRKAVFIGKLIEAQIDVASEFEFECVYGNGSFMLYVSSIDVIIYLFLL